MGREVKRVQLDFDWPLNEPWEGFLSPEKFQEHRCADCYGAGSTPAMQWITRMALMLDQLIDDVDQQAAHKPMHPWLAQDQYPPVDRNKILARRGFMVEYAVIRPSEDIIEFAQALVAGDENERYRTIERGRMAQNKDAITFGLLRVAGLPNNWGWCKTCNGHGSVEMYPGQRAEAEAWEASEPPTGDGWQLWETVSEGSPVSAVFASAEDLAQWLTTEAGGRVSGPSGTPMSIEHARRFVDAGWAPSMVADSQGIHDGAAYVGAHVSDSAGGAE